MRISTGVEILLDNAPFLPYTPAGKTDRVMGAPYLVSRRYGFPKSHGMIGHHAFFVCAGPVKNPF